MDEQLIVIKQYPVISERLKDVSEEIKASTFEVMQLEVTEDTVKEAKKKRTELNKKFSALEEQRKTIKSAIMAPYEKFEKKYKEYVTDVFKPADAELKTKIDEVEKGLLDIKVFEVENYFEEQAAEKGIDFLTFSRLGIKVLMSESKNKLKDKVDMALTKIAGELSVIDTLEDKDEVLIEYRESLNLSDAILKVKNRKEKLEQERAKKEAAEKAAKKTVIVPTEPEVILIETTFSEPAPTEEENVKEVEQIADEDLLDFEETDHKAKTQKVETSTDFDFEAFLNEGDHEDYTLVVKCRNEQERASVKKYCCIYGIETENLNR